MENEVTAVNDNNLMELTADVVAAYVGNNPVQIGDLPGLIADIHAALARVSGAAEPAPQHR